MFGLDEKLVLKTIRQLTVAKVALALYLQERQHAVMDEPKLLRVVEEAERFINQVWT